MKTTKVFKSGHSQAVRIPIDFQFHSDEVEIFKQGNEVVLREKPRNLSDAFRLLGQLAEDCFKDERKDDQPQMREF